MVKNFKFKVVSTFAVIVVLAFSTMSCNNSSKKSIESAKDKEVVEIIVVEDVWIIDEHQINDIPLTSAANEKSASKEVKTKDNSSDREDEYEIAKMQTIKAAFVEQRHQIEEDVTIDIIQIKETQTVFSINKKGKDEGTVQVISCPGSDEIEQVIFMKGKHKDVYNVEAGMSGKEVRKLRRELKHMVKRGQVFLYTESSNIMYLMDDKILEDGVTIAEDITIEEVEELNVEAIIWKDKKHHKKK